MTDGQQADADLTRLVGEFFSKTFPPEVVAAVEADGLAAHPHLWKATEQLGLPLIGVDEDRGGSGGTLLDLLAVLQGAGRHAVPLPVAETGLAAGLLSSAGAEVPAGPMTIVPDASELSIDGACLSGTAAQVPWARDVGRIVALVLDHTGSPRVVVIDPAQLEIEPGADLAGMPSDRVTAREVRVESHPAGCSPGQLMLRGALARSAQMAGAMTGAYEITRRYVTERMQFGRPIARFQSVQAHIVELAEAAVLVTLSVERAGRAAVHGAATLEIVSTKSVADRHAGLVTRASHQAHGAIGMTREYPLQQLTRRLHCWRGEFGEETALNLRLGAAMARHGGLIASACSVRSTVEV